MKKGVLFLLLGLMVSPLVWGQKKLISNPVLEFTYYVEGEGGANGLTVAYNPDNGYYYCIQAGNADFPLEAFTGTGERIFASKAKVDARGFWYNKKLKCFEGTMYLGGTYKMYLNSEGIPSNPILQSNSMTYSPPQDQSMAVGNPEKLEMYVYFEGLIYVYDQKTNKIKKKIKLKNSPANFFNCNPHVMIFTGYKNYEFGIHDFVSYKMHFFNASGKYTESILLPYDAPYTEWFRIGYTNDRLFIYDGDYRAWYAYRIFGNGSS